MLSEWHGDIEFRPRRVVYCGVRVTVTILGGLGTSNARFVAPFPIELKIRYNTPRIGGQVSLRPRNTCIFSHERTSELIGLVPSKVGKLFDLLCCFG